MRTRTPITERLARSAVRDEATGCLLWQLQLDDEGYGHIWVPDVGVRGVHRVAWQLANGRLPGPGMEVDHKCRVRHCVEPAHLEEVTKRVNVARSSMSFDLTERCRSGRHEMKTEDDWFTQPDGTRRCKACRREWQAEWREKNRTKIRQYDKTWRQVSV